MLKLCGYLATRAWLIKHHKLVRRLKQIPDLRMQGNTRLWECPWVYTQLQERECKFVLDIGAGTGCFTAFLRSEGYDVIGVDNYQWSWADTKQVEVSGLDLRIADATNLPFGDGTFDAAVLISAIEHMPSNTIYCDRRRCMKTAEMLRKEVPFKLSVINEALRVTKPEGVVILTSDIYLDYPPEVNISWRQLFGLKNIDRSDLWPYDGTLEQLWGLYFSDFPVHKGRVLPIGVTIDKRIDEEG